MSRSGMLPFTIRGSMPAHPISSQTPTAYFYARLQWAFDHFNGALFNGALHQCLLTVRSSNRHHGYHHARRFISPQGELIGELGLHPGYFTVQPVESAMATLVHEMVHVWQHQHGRPTKSKPHNREWADKMKAIGLQPSHNGLPGGNETGHAMSDYILPSSSFIDACRALISEGFELPWLDRHLPQKAAAAHAYQDELINAGLDVGFSAAPVQSLPETIDGKPTVYEPKPSPPKQRHRFECPACQMRAWAKADADLLCGTCEHPLAHIP